MAALDLVQFDFPLAARIVATWILAGVFIVNIAAFAWAIRVVFVRSGGMPLPMRALGVSGLAAAMIDVWILFDGEPPRLPATVAGVVLCAVGITLFCAAERATRQSRLRIAFSHDDPTFLIATGPYASLRHPFYVSYGLTWIGMALGSGAWLPWLFAAAFCAVYIARARAEERMLLRSSLAAEYVMYSRSTGMLFPALRTRRR